MKWTGFFGKAFTTNVTNTIQGQLRNSAYVQMTFSVIYYLFFAVKTILRKENKNRDKVGRMWRCLRES
jgi:hypothetical protein